MRALNQVSATVLEGIRLAIEEDNGEPGQANSDPTLDAFDAFNMYLVDVVDALRQEFEVSDEDALMFALDLADELAADDELPLLPDEGDAAATAAWMEAAKKLGFVDRVVQAAIEENA